jgi:hypothetical protein
MITSTLRLRLRLSARRLRYATPDVSTLRLTPSLVSNASSLRLSLSANLAAASPFRTQSTGAEGSRVTELAVSLPDDFLKATAVGWSVLTVETRRAVTC